MSSHESSDEKANAAGYHFHSAHLRSPIHALGQEAPSHPNPPSISEVIEFRRIYYLLLKKLWVISTIVIIGMVAVSAWLIRHPKIYESRAVLEVDEQQKRTLKDEEVMGGTQNTDFVNTVMHAITSRNIMLRVVKSNHLESNARFAPPKSGGWPYNDDELASRMESKVKVTVRHNARVIDILVEDTNPTLACTLATSVVKEFLRETLQQRMLIANTSNEILQEEAEKLKTKLEKSELELQRYKEEHHAVSLEENQNIVMQKLHDVNTALTEAKNTRLKLEADLEKLHQTDPGDTDALLQISSVANLREVGSLRAQINQAESDLATMEGHYLDKNPKHVAAVNKINGLKSDLASEVKKATAEVTQQYQSALGTEHRMEESLKEQEQKALELNKLSIPYGTLVREVASSRTLYDNVISQLNQTGVLATAASYPYHLIEEPLVPSGPSKPKIKLTLLLSFIFLSVGAVAAIILIDGLSPGIRTLDDAEESLNLPVLGAIPDIELIAPELLSQQLARERAVFPERIGRFKKLVSEIRSKKRSLRDLTLTDFKSLFYQAPKLPEEQPPEAKTMPLVEDPAAQISEAYRTLRASIDMLLPTQDYQFLLFTSAVPEEGKSFTSMNCAIAFAQQGFKTLLIDGDLRRPTFHKTLLNGEDRAGLTDYLAESSSLEDVICMTAIPGLFLLTSGQKVNNPSELLSRSDLPGLITKLKGRFDRIIIDSAPVNAVSDTLYLTSAAQKVILVMRAEKTPLAAIRRAIKLVRGTGATIAGTVLNKMSRGISSGYYYYYYGDKYQKESVYGTGRKS